MKICSICREETMSGIGNNALPINSGRCCDQCDMEIVVPTRLMMSGFTPTAARAIGRESHMRPPEYMEAMLNQNQKETKNEDRNQTESVT